MKTKICGFTQSKDIAAASKLGIWAVGFNFYRASPRYLSVEKARELSQFLPEHVKRIGLFVEDRLEHILNVAEVLNLDFMQVYRDYNCSPELKKRMIRAICPFNESEIPSDEVLRDYAMILLDAPKILTKKYGGSGYLADWKIAEKLARSFSLILAGGLRPENVCEAIQRTRPFAIDVCSGVESSPGIKCEEKMRSFLNRIQDAL